MTTQLEQWLKEFPRQEVEAKVHQLEAELTRWKNALAIHESLTEEGRAAGRQTPTKPQAIATILQAADHPLRPGEIVAEMVRQGWLPGDSKAKRRFYATMSRLTAEDRITRLSDGRYVLPSNSQEALPGGLHQLQ
jgi:hypothetical protein